MKLNKDTCGSLNWKDEETFLGHKDVSEGSILTFMSRRILNLSAGSRKLCTTNLAHKYFAHEITYFYSHFDGQLKRNKQDKLN